MTRKTEYIVLLVLVFATIGIMIMTNEAKGANGYQALPGNGFTYQGQLKTNGILADNTCDFRFSLWSESADGTQVGDAQIKSGVEVNNGYFTVANLDFGKNAFDGQARWLEIEVKCSGDTIFTTLTPRQAITPAPYALALPGLFTQQNETSPNVIGGYHGNLVTEGIHGAVIDGGGTDSSLNRVTDHYSTVSGGTGNQAGNADEIQDNAQHAVVSGGENNTANADHALVAGGGNNITGASYASIGGGYDNIANAPYTSIGGGSGNIAAGVGAFIGGGGEDGISVAGNQTSGNASTIVGGLGNSIAITGTYAAISGGESNHIDRQNAAIGGGKLNNAHGDYSSISGGLNAETTLFGQISNASGAFSENGDAQASTYILRNSTTDATATELFLDGASERLTIQTDRTMAFEIFVAAKRNAFNQSAGYYFRGVIKNEGGITSFVPSTVMITLGEDNPAWEITISASDAYDALIIQVSGAENANIRWVATVRAVEVAW
ncbi:MAG: hypothetical protein JW908_02850 [Anaerolineales bacterium]|nr:hypothetical protein [Anaerolineales bacterium]